jgi:hypothetical protein
MVLVDQAAEEIAPLDSGMTFTGSTWLSLSGTRSPIPRWGRSAL